MDRVLKLERQSSKLWKIGMPFKISKNVSIQSVTQKTGVVVLSRASLINGSSMDQFWLRTPSYQDTEDKRSNYPHRFNDTFLQWMENVHDWVISRQLCGGHQIPASGNADGEMYVGEEAPEGVTDGLRTKTSWILGSVLPSGHFQPWAGLKSTQKTLNVFPTLHLVKQVDIIFFWVSRMITSSLEFTGRQPHQNVLFSTVSFVTQGDKMSKSHSVGIDPMDVIAKYGADALRWFSSNASAPGDDVRFSYEKKWMLHGTLLTRFGTFLYILTWTMEVWRWMWRKTMSQKLQQVRLVMWRTAGFSTINETIAKVTENFDKFEFEVWLVIYFTSSYGKFANWCMMSCKEDLYSTITKEKVISRSVLLYTLRTRSFVSFPIMPFVWEEIFGQISQKVLSWQLHTQLLI